MSPEPFEFQRPTLVEDLVRRCAQPAPCLLFGPPGAGKSTLVRRAAQALEARGARTVTLDLLAAVSTPERFVGAVLQALPAEGSGQRLADAIAIRQLAEAGRARGADAVRALCDLLAAADRAGERPLVLLLDEITEIRSLAYFPGLRHADQLLGDALRARRGGTLLVTSFPTLARKLWHFDELALPALQSADVAALTARVAPHVDPAALVAAAGGSGRAARLMLEEASTGVSLAQAFSASFAPGGRLEQACRATYEMLLLRSRGYGACKAALHAVALEPGLNLTALTGRLGRTPGATRDYLHWLVGVDALRMERKRYVFVDGLLALWVRLYGAGANAQESALAAAFEARVGPTGGPVVVPQAFPDPAPEPAHDGLARPRHDRLMEID